MVTEDDLSEDDLLDIEDTRDDLLEEEIKQTERH